MKRLLAALWIAFAVLVGAHSASAQIVQFSGAPIFTGFLDQFSAQGATEYWSCTFKSTNAYSSSCGVVQRQSDNATQTINFLSSGKGDVATFNSFCSGTNCYLKSWTGQLNGVTFSQATLANMPRAYVNANGNIAACGTPTSSMTTSFNSAVNTAKVHLFAVAKASLADFVYSTPDVPTTAITANLTNGSAAISSMSSQTGISATAGSPGYQTVPGIVDSAGALPNAPLTGTTGRTNLLALPTGSTGTMGPSGLTTASSSQTGDTLTFTNAVTSGAWIINGPASSSFASSAYWGMGFDSSEAATLDFPRNAGGNQYGNFVNNGMRGQWGVYDFDTFTGHLAYNGTDLGTQVSSANVTYSTNVGLTLFSNANGTENASNNCFETMVLFPATEASRVSMAQFLMAQDSITFPFAPATSDGFTMTGAYVAGDTSAGATVYGQNTYGPDVLGMSRITEAGGYIYPSLAFANNINNSTTMWRHILHQGDTDVWPDANERSEVDISSTIASGGHASMFYQFEFEAIPTQSGDWCYSGQVHYAAGVIPPDLITFSCLNNQIQFILQCCDVSASPGQQNCGTATTITVGQVYAVEIELSWSSGGTTDTAVVHFGPNGSPLPQTCSVSGSIWNSSGTRTANMKHGVYRGFPNRNAGTIIQRVINAQFSNTANAFSGFIATQPALPTHL